MWYVCWMIIWCSVSDHQSPLSSCGSSFICSEGPNMRWSYTLHQPQVPSRWDIAGDLFVLNQPWSSPRLLEDELVSPTCFSIALILADRSKTTTAGRPLASTFCWKTKVALWFHFGMNQNAITNLFHHNVKGNYHHQSTYHNSIYHMSMFRSFWIVMYH